MSTFYPKTLRQWKVQKSSRTQLMDIKNYHLQQSFAKSAVIHALGYDNSLKRQSISKEKTSNLSSSTGNIKNQMKLSNGFRRYHKSINNKTLSHDFCLQKIQRLARQDNKFTSRMHSISNFIKCSITKKRAIKKNKNILETNTIEQRYKLGDLLIIKTPTKIVKGQLLFIDGNNKNIEGLEDDQNFSPYRQGKQGIQQVKHRKTDHSAIKINQTQPQKQNNQLKNQKNDQNIRYNSQDSNNNFMSISNINLRQRQSWKKMVKKVRCKTSLNDNRDKSSRKKSIFKFDGKIIPWQDSQK